MPALILLSLGLLGGVVAQKALSSTPRPDLSPPAPAASTLGGPAAAPAPPDATLAASQAAARAAAVAGFTRRRAAGGSDLVTLPGGNFDQQSVRAQPLQPRTLIGH